MRTRSSHDAHLDDEEKRLFDRAFREHKLRVQRFLSSRLGSTTRASTSEDLLQETFYRAMAASTKPAYDRSRPVLPYLLGVAANVIANTRRSSHRSKSLESALQWTIHISAGSLLRADARGFPEDGILDLVPVMIVPKVEMWLKNQPPLLREVWRRRFVSFESQRRVSIDLHISRRRLRTLECQLRV